MKTASETTDSPRQTKLARFLKQVWADEANPRLRFWPLLKRLIQAIVLFILVWWCRNVALDTARWPEPVKYIGIALLILAVGLLVWGLATAWKFLKQLRLKWLLIVSGSFCAILIAIFALISEEPLLFHRRVWLIAQQGAVSIGNAVRDAVQALIETPAEFRFAYTGHRRPILLPGMDPYDTSYLTPIPANRPAQIVPGTPATTPTRSPGATPKNTPASGPTATVKATTTNLPRPTLQATATPAATKGKPTTQALQPPDCPYPLAHLTKPRVNEVIRDEIQVEGSANIESFSYYKFEFKREDVADEWHWAESFYQPVENGVLGIWRVSHLPEGIYTFRLTAVNIQGNYPFPPCEVPVQIKH